MARKYEYFVYILTNFKKTVLYTGVTNNLEQRIIEHYLDRGNDNSFCGRYSVFYLLHFETFDYIRTAIEREKQIKKWSRKKKIDLIKRKNSELKFLNLEFFGTWPPVNCFHRRDSRL